FGISVGTCYAASNSIEVDITATRAYGKFVYEEAGHQIKVTVFYTEKDSFGLIRDGDVSDTQFGNVTTAVVSRSNSNGCQYLGGYAVGYVDGSERAVSGPAYA
ncbi:MAG: hypothetical protein K2N41_03545, partial [Lachnospiraceae bacterium]|nr:hypothetical protein [Lachnospiraceae bacterium]